MKRRCGIFLLRCSYAMIASSLRKHLHISLIVMCSLLPQVVFALDEGLSFYSNFKDLALKDQFNKPFSINNTQNKTVLFNFIYTQCSTSCSLQTNSLAEILNTLPSDLRSRVAFVSVSLDPLHDTPDQLRKYMHRHHAKANNWSFITGSLNDIATLSERLKLYGQLKSKSENAKRPDDHTTYLWLVDKEGRLMMRYKGNPIDKARLAQEITQLIKS
jgi:protein SCO1/2